MARQSRARGRVRQLLRGCVQSLAGNDCQPVRQTRVRGFCTLLVCGGALLALVAPSSSAPAHGVEELVEATRVPRETLAQRLARQLERIEAESALLTPSRERRLREAELSMRGTPRDLERYRRRALAEDARHALLEDLELSRLTGAAPHGKAARILGRIELSRSIDRILRRVALERRVQGLERALDPGRTRGLGLHP